MEGLNKERISFKILLFDFQDILKIGGPYTRLAFLNASTVSKVKQININ
jgi:hypothetical protein